MRKKVNIYVVFTNRRGIRYVVLRGAWPGKVAVPERAVRLVGVTRFPLAILIPDT
jgi:hypothetical protein